MARKAKWLGIISVATALLGVAIAQTPVDKLELTGKMSFRLNDSPYYIRLGVACDIPAFEGGIGDQQPLCITFADLNNDGIALDFQLTINQMVNSIQSTETVTWIAQVLSSNQVRWTTQRTFSPPHCTVITISGTDYIFQMDEIYGQFQLEITEGSCAPDPYNCFGCGVDLSLAPFGGADANYMGFNGRAMLGGTCDSGPVPACARAYDLQINAYSGGLSSQGDVNGDCVVDDADLLAVLFAFGQSGSGLAEDINRDGTVDDADLLIVLFNFGNSC